MLDIDINIPESFKKFYSDIQDFPLADKVYLVTRAARYGYLNFDPNSSSFTDPGHMEALDFIMEYHPLVIKLIVEDQYKKLEKEREFRLRFEEDSSYLKYDKVYERFEPSTKKSGFRNQTVFSEKFLAEHKISEDGFRREYLEETDDLYEKLEVLPGTNSFKEFLGDVEFYNRYSSGPSLRKKIHIVSRAGCLNLRLVTRIDESAAWKKHSSYGEGYYGEAEIFVKNHFLKALEITILDHVTNILGFEDEEEFFTNYLEKIKKER